MKYLARKYWVEAFAALIVFWRLNDNSLHSIWLSRWLLLLVGALILLTRYIYRRVHPAVAWISFTTILSVLYTVFWTPRFGAEPFEVQLGLKLASAMAGLMYVILLFAALAMTCAQGLRILTGLAISGLVYPLIIYVRWGTGQDVHSYLPFFDNPSMAASFIVLCLFLIDRGVELLPKSTLLRCVIWAYGLGAVLLTTSSTPLLALGLGWGVRLLHAKGETKRKLVMGLGLGSPVLVAIALHLDSWHGWVSDSGRFWIWGSCIKFWWHSGMWNVVTGFGAGTLRVLYPIIQMTDPTNSWPSTYILWLHNDWVQMLMEQGLLGFSAFLYLVYSMFKRRREPGFQAVCAAFGGVMFTNFPFHMAPHALFGVLLVHAAFRGND